MCSNCGLWPLELVVVDTIVKHDLMEGKLHAGLGVAEQAHEYELRGGILLGRRIVRIYEVSRSKEKWKTG